VDMDGNGDIFADTPVLTESAAAPAKPVSKAGAAGGAYYYREATEAAKDVQTEMEALKITVPKPTFTGTPKDIKSDNLEEPGARRGQVVHVSEEVSSSAFSYSAQPSQKPGAVVNGTTTVSGGTLSFSGKAKEDSKWVSDKEILARAKHEEEARFRQVDGKAEADKTVDTSRLISDQLKKNLENNVRDEGYVSNAPKRGDVGGQIIAGNDMSRRNEEGEKKQLVDQKKLALDLPRKPSRPSEPLPFNPFVMTAAEQFSTFAMDVDTASYTLTRQSLRSGKLPDPERVRLEEIVNAFDYGDKASDKATFRIYQDGAQSQFGAGYNLLRIGVKGRRLGREEQRPAMLTMVLDVSGSMSQPDRIGFARLSLSSLLDQMGADDRIQLIAYSDQAQFVIEPTAAKEKKKIMDAFDRLQCNGSTNLEEGLRRAYEQAVQAFIPGAENRVILISDGVANLGADSAQEILDKVAANRKQGITCSVFGVGAGTYNDQMLEGLANKGDGVYRFLDSAEAVKTAFVDDLAATLNTIAKDAKIQVEWNPKTVSRYRQMGYENRKLTKEQFRDDTVDAGEVGSGQSVTALYELELMPNVTAESNIGTVRVRYQRTDNGKVEEISAPLLAATVLKPAHLATPAFKVAASAAEFAELLRNSPNAQGGNFESVADYLRPAALEMTLDTRVKELLELVTTAHALSK
jgi:Ca-activated chloride channel homolog